MYSSRASRAGGFVCLAALFFRRRDKERNVSECAEQRSDNGRTERRERAREASSDNGVAVGFGQRCNSGAADTGRLQKDETSREFEEELIIFSQQLLRTEFFCSNARCCANGNTHPLNLYLTSHHICTLCTFASTSDAFDEHRLIYLTNGSHEFHEDNILILQSVFREWMEGCNWKFNIPRGGGGFGKASCLSGATSTSTQFTTPLLRISIRLRKSAPERPRLCRRRRARSVRPDIRRVTSSTSVAIITDLLHSPPHSAGCNNHHGRYAGCRQR
ncbi:hypothetical protein PUN28_008537 [Cardiocondyla obscurior]|uniref:Uncharacterized protein n=1 Tax=Cardiocondyla obscurior TaxID=286306 RepID=A0AAW2G327_9HYME